MPHLDDDRVVRVALGESPVSAGERVHLDDCATCTLGLTAMSAVVRAGRDAPRIADFRPPPPNVWRAIAAAKVNRVGGTAGRTRHTISAQRGSVRAPLATQRRRRVAALLVTALLGATVTLGIVRFQATPVPPPQAGATLTPQAQVAATASGTATVVTIGGARYLRIHVTGLPAPTGFFAVWLYDPDTGALLTIGILDRTGDADLPVPSTVDPTAFRVVEVSAQSLLDGPEAGPSMLRGTLSPYGQKRLLPNGIEGRRG